MKTFNKEGFSLIELLVALSILAVVSAIIVPRFLNVRQEAATTVTGAQQQELQSAVHKWIALEGTFASSYSDIDNSGDVLSFLSSRSAASTPMLVDSSGKFNSGSIALSITSAAAAQTKASPSGFYFANGSQATYSDGAGTVYNIVIYHATGNVEFIPQAGMIQLVANVIGPTS